MANIFTGSTANQVWLAGAKALHSLPTIQESRIGLTKELLHVHYEIKDPIQRWVISRKPAINPAFSLAEVIWILSGRNDSKFINYWNPALSKYTGDGDTYHGAYGDRIKKHFGFDQLDYAYQALKNNSSTRQVVIQLWDSRIDFPDRAGLPKSTDIPCNICSIVKIRNSKVEWLQVMRSNDHYRGTPYNFVQFTTLQEVLAGWLGCGVGTYCQISDSAHIYLDDSEKFYYKKNLRDIRNNDSLLFSKDDFELVLTKLVAITELLSDKSLRLDSFKTKLKKMNIPKGYMNWVYILGADAARRRDWDEEKNWAANRCSNEAIKFLWVEWDKRWGKS